MYDDSFTQYYRNKFDVIADEMHKTQFSFLCPFCKNRHYHGNCLDTKSNRIEERLSHCALNPREIRIKIDDSTKRLLPTGTVS